MARSRARSGSLVHAATRALEAADRLPRVAGRLAEPGEDRGEVGAVDGEVVLDGQGHGVVGDGQRLGGRGRRP